MNIVILGLSITSSWGNGHATIFRGLVRALARRGHRVLFLERDTPWYAANRDMPQLSEGRVELYTSVTDLKRRFGRAVREAELVIVGSGVPEGVAVGRWVVQRAGGIAAFYDIDTPVTIGKLERGDCEYLSGELVRAYRLYLSFTGGPTLDRLEHEFGSPCVRPWYCCVDPALYYPEACEAKWDLGYMGTYSDDRQAKLEQLMLEPARRWARGRFVVAGAQYPGDYPWPSNVDRIDHLPAAAHRRFYCHQRFTLNLTREEMVRAGYSPSVRLFEAAACGTPIISDAWPGLETFFSLGSELLVAECPEEVMRYLRQVPEERWREIGERARQRVLAEHTAEHRACQLEGYVAALTPRQAMVGGGG